MSTTPPPPATPPAYSGSTAPVAKTNTLAIIALVLGIVVPLGGIIVGHIALAQIKRTGEAGRGLALAGTIIGYVLTIGYILLIVLSIVASLALAGAGYSTYNN